MEHLTIAGQTFISWFGRTQNGYLFMLTKRDNAHDILEMVRPGITAASASSATSLSKEDTKSAGRRSIALTAARRDVRQGLGKRERTVLYLQIARAS